MLGEAPRDVALLGDCALLTDVALPSDDALLANIALWGNDALLADVALLAATLPALACVLFSSLLPLRRQVHSTRRNAACASLVNAKPKMPALASSSVWRASLPFIA
jgi:hypothetical protein